MTENPLDYVLSRLREARGKRRQIARAAGVCPRTVDKLVDGTRPDPRFSTVWPLYVYLRGLEFTSEASGERPEAAPSSPEAARR